MAINVMEVRDLAIRVAIKRWGVSADVAEDLAQDISIRALKHEAKIRSWKPYVVMMVRYAVYNYNTRSRETVPLVMQSEYDDDLIVNEPADERDPLRILIGQEELQKALDDYGGIDLVEYNDRARRMALKGKGTARARREAYEEAEAEPSFDFDAAYENGSIAAAIEKHKERPYIESYYTSNNGRIKSERTTPDEKDLPEPIFDGLSE